MLRHEFFAIDVETTGLSPETDRIVEIGVAHFTNGQLSDTYSTLIRSDVPIPDHVSKINHITNEMLTGAPPEQEVIPELVSFLGSAMSGNIYLCAHNATFDLSFLSNALERFGHSGRVCCVDTLPLSRRLLDLPNHKQETVVEHFGHRNPDVHRALSDACTCGSILLSLLDLMDEEIRKEKERMEKRRPRDEEFEVCATIQNLLKNKGFDTSWLRFGRNSNGYIDVTCLYIFLRFKFTKKGNYILIKNSAVGRLSLPVQDATQSEGGTSFKRAYFTSPEQILELEEYICRSYAETYESMNDYINQGENRKSDALRCIQMLYALSDEEVAGYLQSSANRVYEPATPPVTYSVEETDIVIHAENNRCPLEQIRNLNNPTRGHIEGFPLWEEGEILRKSGFISEAIEKYDQAREHGYDAPALYISYARAYRKLKDYDNEIAIIDEYIARGAASDGEMAARRSKAIQLLKEQKEKAVKREQGASNTREKAPTLEPPERPRHGKRAILQMDDDGNTIQEYPSLSAAIAAVGISSKSIRDAANGVQKHAGGYCWKYKDQE